MEKLNIAEILKDCSNGTKLYSLVHGEVELKGVYKDMIRCKPNYLNDLIDFYFDGRWVKNEGECILFPSKENRDWAKFQRPFKEGDILYIDCNDDGNTDEQFQYIFILKEIHGSKIYSYCFVTETNEFKFEMCYLADRPYHPRFATEEEKEKLFKAIKANGYCWNAKTKTLEKLIEPKFKVGDRIVKQNSISNSWIVSFVSSEYYGLTLPNGSESIGVLPVSEQDDYELLPNTNKFDVTTLNPFDRVLVRHSDTDYWKPALWGKHITSQCSPFISFYGFTVQAIPFKGNEHLVGTTNDCDDYFKTWE